MPRVQKKPASGAVVVKRRPSGASGWAKWRDLREKDLIAKVALEIEAKTQQGRDTQAETLEQQPPRTPDAHSRYSDYASPCPTVGYKSPEIQSASQLAFGLCELPEIRAKHAGRQASH